MSGVLTGPDEPRFALPPPWHWVRRAGLWAAQDHAGTHVRSWSASDPTRMVTIPKSGTRTVPLGVYVAVSAANDPGTTLNRKDTP